MTDPSHHCFGRIDFEAPHLPVGGLCFGSFDSIIRADCIDEVLPALRAVEAACMDGSYAMGFIAYEAAPAFDSACRTRPSNGLPLLFFGLAREPSPRECDTDAAASLSPFTPAWDEAAYLDRFNAIQQKLCAGETYQVNLTFPLTAHFEGSTEAFYQRLRHAQGSAYCGMIQGPGFTVLSSSPELFFDRRGNRLETRPMKGTRTRGRTTVEDAEIAAELRRSEKDRAENVMIVDLLRNDLGRVAVTGSVQAPSLFSVEKYPTVWQMTSTVRAELRPGAGLVDTFSALFPCGSVTGAPKVKTMEIISELEESPRGVYCGAFGVILPGGDCTFNVPIRTMTIVGNDARYPVGSGLVVDSDGASEYEECLIKARVVDRCAHPFRLLETLLWEPGDGFFLLDRHLRRLAASAKLFGFQVDPGTVEERLHAMVEEATGAMRVRLLVDAQGSVEVQGTETAPGDNEIKRVKLADEPVDSKHRYLYHKTTRREVYDRERARLGECFDAILYNERDEVTESTIANVAVQLGGCWYTPPVRCGLLPGVMRAELLANGELAERVITIDELRLAENIRLINSVRRQVDVILD